MTLPRARLASHPLRLAAVLAFATASHAHAGEAAADAATLPAVNVTATHDSPQHLRDEISGGALGSLRQLDTPFSTTIVTSEELEARRPYKLGDVFAGDASVSDNSGAYGAWASYATVRGMQVDWQNGFKIDGLPFVAYGITMPYEQLERVELLKGLGGFMYGFATPGGVINYVTKQPGAAPVRSIDVGYRSTNIWTEHVDLGQRFGPNGMFGARLNATHEEGKTYNDGNIRRDSVSLALQANLTRDLSVNFGALYQERRTTGQTPSIFMGGYKGGALPATISGGTTNLGGTDQYLNTNLQLYTFGAQYQLAPDWQLSATYSYSKATRKRNESTLALQNAAGDYTDSRYVGMEDHRFSQWQAMLEGKVRTGPFSHRIVLGAAWQKQANDYPTNSVFQSLGAGNLYAPNPYRFDSPHGFVQYRDSEITQKSLFASDTIALTERWSVLAGARYMNYAQTSFKPTGGTNPGYAQSGVVTPTFAVMFKVAPATTAYASYVESLEPGSRVNDVYANAGQVLKPLRSKQYEVGIKSEQARWSATAALFRIERMAEYANAANVYVQDGEAVFQGLELGATAQLGRQWNAGLDLMLLDAWYAKGAANNGNRVAGAPRFVVAGKLGYAVPAVPGLTLGVDAKFTGATPLRAAGGIDAPGFLVVNAGASYLTRIGRHDVTLRASLDNLLNRRYWEFQYADYVKPGDPRTVSVSARIDF
ncbi:TonB-dependent siderophore receptor [Burkholderia ubonensis]|uniref:TonB-dependent siderophore receptor n=1 Tax=Burkholderia ubonensis TaxID=101571 RepID=UPI000BA6C1BC|nr:TonB-dependent receptor [Burkholderia ubonensis]PAK10297.1 TonB-dependent siderophore receptor [Burkholderia ubonensis]RQP88903.1 TonB-dependent receptor [Burkholderia ubonensis]